MSQNRKRLLGTFIRINEDESEIEKITSFIFKTSKKLELDKKEFYVYHDLDDKGQFIITYNLEIEAGNPIKYTDIHRNTIPINKNKFNAIYTINALNKLIEEESEMGGNVDHRTFKIDWEKFKDSLILLKGDTLIINRIKRIFL